MTTHKELYAYALGYFDGRMYGESKDLYADDLDILRLRYKEGYDAGVADYCYEISITPTQGE
jgi:hypothetical protein